MAQMSLFLPKSFALRLVVGIQNCGTKNRLDDSGFWATANTEACPRGSSGSGFVIRLRHRFRDLFSGTGRQVEYLNDVHGDGEEHRSFGNHVFERL